eukprot:GFKZ01014112.1.p1 GENE.GFKZ01014112.1~~GFKZ01014112.1.p1  ORF type:complete len:463 (+),score=68.25 GFKZ01014112.1:189-1577(+)
MQRIAVINIVGLTPSLVSQTHTPFISSFLLSHPPISITPPLPAVTTTVQSTYLTGQPPSRHGIVANGWYSRPDAEIKFWKQSNHLVESPKIWDEARRRDPSNSFTVANSFWWYNMYSSVDYACTPRPMYPADGRKIPDVYTKPAELRERLQDTLGQFPLFNFWGPKASIESSAWIAEAAKIIESESKPTLHLVYLPHLDYCLQKVGPYADKISTELREIDDVVNGLVTYFEEKDVDVVLISEYGVGAVDGVVYINRELRKEGLIKVRRELGRELLDPGACKAFAVADHQIAHVYVNDDSEKERVKKLLESLDGVARVLDDDGKRELGLDHERAGDFVCVADENYWFAYYYWLDDDVAPDFARCVDIHRKPGYDPVELFIDPEITFPMMKAAWRLTQKELGFRYLMDLIPLDATLVKGSHGCVTADADRGPFLATRRADVLRGKSRIQATEVFDILLQLMNLH